jgi:hypothetical protein
MKKKPIKIKVTLEDVLNVTKEGFKRVDKKFDEIDVRLNNIDVRLNNIEGTMATKDDILRIENRFERRIEILEDDVRVLKTTVGKK